MAKKVKQLCSEVCVIYKLHSAASKTDSVGQFVDFVYTFFGVYNNLPLLENNQSTERWLGIK